MQIDHITYERRVSDGAYGNRLFHASATLDEGEDVLTAAATVRAFVADQIERDIKEEREREEAERKRRQEEYERRQAEREAQYAREREERQKSLDTALSDDGAHDPIPFDDEEEDDE